MEKEKKGNFTVVDNYIPPADSEKRTFKNIVLTGGTGFLGRHFAMELLDKTNDHIYAIVREKKGVPFSQREEIAGLLNNRFHILNGDITCPNITDLSKIPVIDEVWHLAGSTDFQEDRWILTYSLNVDGVRNVVNLAKKLNVKKFYHVSTAYVAGIKNGKVPEDGLVAQPMFRNPYEETKYQGEAIVRNSGLPFIIIRPSIVMGHSESGEVESDKMVYGVVKLYHLLFKLLKREYRDKGKIPDDLRYFTKGEQDATKNLIAVDDVIRVMNAIRENGEIGKTYHVCNPKYNTVWNIIQTIQDSLNINIVNLSMNMVESNDKKQKMINKGVKIYEPYMTITDPIFDLTNVSNVYPIEKIKQFTKELQLFMYSHYIKNRLQKTIEVNGSKPDFRRLKDITLFGRQTLSFSALYTDKEVLKIPYINGFLPYVRSDHTAVMVSDPISDNPEVLIKAFIDMCQSEGMNPSAIQITEDIAKIFAQHDFFLNKLGIETVLDLKKYDSELKGKKYEKLRRWRNNAEDNDINVVENHLSKINREEVQKISDKWITNKMNHSELGVLLRKMILSEEPYVRRFYAMQDGKILGYIFFDPMFSGGDVIGYYANIERYHTDGKPIHGLLPAVIMAAAKKFKSEGLKKLSLGLSPLYSIEDNPFNEHEVLREVFEQFYEENTLYAFKGIAGHKRKYPATKIPVYFASRKDSSIEDIFNIFNSVGILNLDGENGS
jgi:nucleoside-diphosphate-sugar epimerase